jgi:hypothetical protein
MINLANTCEQVARPLASVGGVVMMLEKPGA